MLILIQGEGAIKPEVFSHLEGRSDGFLSPYLRYNDVDDFVRRADDPHRYYKVDFMLQAEYFKLSEDARRVIYDMVV